MNLFELRDRVLTLPTLEKRMDLLQKEILAAEGTVSLMLRRYDRECRDVKQIQKNSFSSFMFKLIRKYDGKLEKEQREEIVAKLAYDRAVTHLECLGQEKNELTSHILALQADKELYQTELANRRQDLNNPQAVPGSVQYAELEIGRNVILGQITETERALDALAHVKLTVENTLKSLKSAQDWATYDLFARGGVISHMAKYSRIDEAEKNYHLLLSQLQHLKSELNDMEGLTVSGFNEISSSQRSVDFWFDNIFTDLSVRNKVKDNTEQMYRLLNDITTIESTLKSKLNQATKGLMENRRQEEDFLLSVYER
ncbi:hypothetical protein [Candidatus Bathycorpusculum sp.]|uniref:hypothetical protein n=1 Tax=Candidatus Bathycorpusculum sp. TaxID=2994959 RepID=UPI0028324B93|nr:hypothetical protein [Candidatus Termitimicrobium sp.]MCL2432525.1 hypothetical protein [Candidatus Termitimicrobium sp.]